MTFSEAITILEKENYKVGINYDHSGIEIESLNTYCAISKLFPEVHKLKLLLPDFSVKYSLDDMEVLITKK